MKLHLVQIAALVLVAAIPVAAARAEKSAAKTELPAKVAIIQIQAIDGLDTDAGNVVVNRKIQYTAGSLYHIDKSVLPSLNNVKTLVLVERRVDTRKGDDLVQNITQEIIASGSDHFNVTGIDEREISYAVDVLKDGSVDLIGPGDRIVAREAGEYHIWKITKTDLVNPDRIVIE